MSSFLFYVSGFNTTVTYLTTRNN